MKSDWLAEHYVRKDVFENLFRIKGRLCGKKILLYGLNSDTKSAIMFLAECRISVEGFLIAQDENEQLGTEYLGKPVLSKEQFLKMDTVGYTVLDVYGDSLQEIWDIFKVRGDTLFEVQPEAQAKSFLIYGTGEGGKRLGAFFARCGVKVACYCARSSKRRDWMDDGCVVITPERLNAVDKTTPIIIAIANPEDVKDVRNLLEVKGFSKIYHFHPDFFVVASMIKRTNGDYVQSLSHMFLFYVRHVLSEGKQIYFFSNDVPYILNVILVMEALGISGGRVATEVNGEHLKNPRVISAYDLCYEDFSTFLVWALPEDEEDAIAFMRKSGLPENIFVRGVGGASYLSRSYILDTHLGYADVEGNPVVRNCAEDENALKLAILGGSTSDYHLYLEKSWPAWLLELAQEAGIKIECTMAATGGNISSQELIRLIRDVVWKKPDIVISYSRINDFCGVKNHLFTHPYQQTVFERMALSMEALPYIKTNKTKSNGLFSMGECHEDNLALHWLANERMMHAVCQEFGIVFYSILQPGIDTKKPKSKFELDIYRLSEQDNMRAWEKMMEDVKPEIPKYPWLYDFTNIFDEMQGEVFWDICHVYGNANRLVAEKILSIIQDSTKENI